VLQFSRMAPTVKPQLAVAERDEVPLLKLSPKVRIEELSQPIPPVPRDAVESFLTRAAILSDAQWKETPYIVADDDDQVVYTARDRVYARGSLFDQPRYQVFRPGEALREPGSDRYLGTAGVYLGEAILDQDGDPATFTLANTIAPIRAGDRLLPIEAERELYSFEPHPVPTGHRGFHHRQARCRRHPDHPVQQRHRQSGRPGRHRARPRPRDLRQESQRSRIRSPAAASSCRASAPACSWSTRSTIWSATGLVMQAERAIHLQDRVTTP
jgi:hypothetical protein